MEYALEIKGLRKEYKGFTLKDVSFTLPRGYVMGLIGPNGAGKTTIVKLIMNLVRKEAGEIRVFGKDHIRDEVEIKSRIGFVYDVPYFYEDAKLKDIKAAIAPFYPGWDDLLFTQLAGEFELPLEKKFKKLSHGMKMKFSLALALSHDAELLILDEPTAGLDPIFRRELLERLYGLMQDERKSILFSTHITTDLERIADYITFIQGGEIVFSSTRDEVLENWAVVKGGKELLSEKNKPYFKSVREGEYGVHALTSSVKDVQRLLGASVTIERATLEDIMFFMVEGRKPCGT